MSLHQHGQEEADRKSRLGFVAHTLLCRSMTSFTECSATSFTLPQSCLCTSVHLVFVALALVPVHQRPSKESGIPPPVLDHVRVRPEPRRSLQALVRRHRLPPDTVIPKAKPRNAL